MATHLADALSRVGDTSACIDRLIKLFRDGGFSALYAEFKSDPIGMVACILTVVAEIIHKRNEHEEIAFGSDETADKLLELASAMELPVQAEEGATDGVFINLVLQRLLAELMRIIMEWLEEIDGD